jgi:hypothetical protein
VIQATFKGMKLGPGLAPVPGPFLVEIFEVPKRIPEFRACVLPTRQRFMDISCATLESCQDAVEAKFTQRLTDWQQPTVERTQSESTAKPTEAKP